MTDESNGTDEIKSKLVPWFQKKMPEAKNIVVSDLEKPGMGLSSVTYLFDIKWEEAGQQKKKELVIRSEPKSLSVFPEYAVKKEFLIMDRLKDTDVPVARMLWMEEDRSIIGSRFFVMERIDGHVPPDYPSYHGSGMFFDAAEEQRAKMWWGFLEAMTKLHMQDWKKLDLSFLDIPGSGTDPIDRQLAYWERYFEWCKEDPNESHPILEASMDWLKKNVYVPENIAICWGDSRMGNTLYSKDTFDTLILMDWEMVYVGDPESDLAWNFLLDWQHGEGAGLPRCEGTPGKEETIARYEEITGRKVKNLFFNEILAAVRFGMILVAVFRKFKTQGVPIEEDMILNNVCTQRLAELLDLPSPGEKRTVSTNIDELTIKIQFHLTGPGGYDWYLISDKGKGSRHDGTVEDPDCSLTVSLEDWVAIRKEELNQLDAWSTGKLVTEGDLNLMQQLEEMISEFSDAELKRIENKS